MLNETVFLVVFTYDKGDQWIYETYSLDDAISFVNNYDHCYLKVEIFNSICVREHYENDGELK